jgi:hypothetical protein
LIPTPNLVALPALKVKDLTGQHEVEAVARFTEAQVNGTSIRLVMQAIKKAVE